MMYRCVCLLVRYYLPFFLPSLLLLYVCDFTPISPIHSLLSQDGASVVDAHRSSRHPSSMIPVPSSLDAPRIKILAVGDAGVGKSCLIKRYCEGRFVDKYIPTIGIDYGVKRVAVSSIAASRSATGGGREARSGPQRQRNGSQQCPDAVRINFWDAAGGDEYAEIRNEFYDAAQGVLLMYDVRNLESFQHLQHWWDEMVVYCEAMPVKQKGVSGGGAAGTRKRTSVTTTGNTAAGKAVGTTEGRGPVIILCATKVDSVVEASSSAERSRRVVTEEMGRTWAADHGCANYCEVSATAEDTVKAAVDSLVAGVSVLRRLLRADLDRFVAVGDVQYLLLLPAAAADWHL